jgi:hypothetical protein
MALNWMQHGLLGGWKLKALAFDSNNNMWCVGLDGTFAKWDPASNAWVRQDSTQGSSWSLEMITFIGSKMFGVQSGTGALGVWDGDQWSAIRSPGEWTLKMLAPLDAASGVLVGTGSNITGFLVGPDGLPEYVQNTLVPAPTWPLDWAVVEPGTGNLWCVLTDNSVSMFRLNAGTTEAHPVPVPVASLAWDNSRALWAVATDGSVFSSNPFSIPDDQKLDILKTYAPRIFLATDEEYFPCSVEWAFPNFDRVAISMLSNDPPMPLPDQSLVAVPSSDERYWLITKEELNTSDELAFFSGNKDLAADPVYAFWVEKAPIAVPIDEIYTDLIYFTYYTYNRGKQGLDTLDTVFGNHVSDWEHMTVRLVWTQDHTGKWSPEPLQAYYSWHSSGDFILWKNVQTVTTHPIAYSASKSHGLYSTPGDHKYGSLPALTDTCSEGPMWDTWMNLAAFDFTAMRGLDPSTPWPAWMSENYGDPGTGDPSIPGNGPIYRWGNQEQGCYPWACQLEDGPTGPIDKPVWAPSQFG